MRAVLVPAIAAPAVTLAVPGTMAGSTSSNSSSNTSSDSGSHGSSYRRSHSLSVDSSDGRRRRVIGGSTHIHRFTPGAERSHRSRRMRIDRYDD